MRQFLLENGYQYNQKFISSLACHNYISIFMIKYHLVNIDMSAYDHVNGVKVIKV